MTRPSPSTVTDEGLEPIRAALYANLRIEPVPNRMYDWRIEAESINEAASAVAEASGHTALLREIEVLREALEPFAQVCNDAVEDSERDQANIWEHPAAMGIEFRDLRRAAATLCRPLAERE